MSKSIASTSAVALVAITGMFSGAQAADLGGNCCADLEERVAELEATAARKGNRKVSLTVSGHVNQAVMFWNDGHESNAYVVDNNTSRTRFRFNGNAKITNDVSAGYLIEIGVRYASSQTRNQNADGAGGNTNLLDIRHSAWYLESKSLGTLWVGKTAQATNTLVENGLGNTNAATNPAYWIGGYLLRNDNATTKSALTWSTLYAPTNQNFDGNRINLVKYVSPSIAGFVASASWGEDDRKDVALRYTGTLAGFKVYGGIGYANTTDFNATADGGAGCANPGAKTAPVAPSVQPTSNAAISDTNCALFTSIASVQHVATGLFVTGVYGQSKDSNLGRLAALTGVNHPVNDTNKMFTLQAGIEQKFFSLGKTTLYGEYSKMNDGNGLAAGQLRTITATDVINKSGATAFLASSEVKVWGIGFNQAIEAASADFYMSFRNYSGSLNTVNAAGAAVANTGIKDFQAVMSGMIIKF
jgi:hypothetical protein